MKKLVYITGILFYLAHCIQAFEADKDVADEMLQDIQAKFGWKEGKNSDGTILSVARVEIPANSNSSDFALVRILAYEQAIMEALVQVAQSQSGVNIDSTQSRDSQLNNLKIGVDYIATIKQSLPEGTFLQGLEIIRTGEHCPKNERCVAVAIARNDPQGQQFAQSALAGGSIQFDPLKTLWADYESLVRMTDEQLLYTQGIRKSLKGNSPVLLSMASVAVQLDTPTGLEMAKNMADAKARQQISLFLESSVSATTHQTSILQNQQVHRDGKVFVSNTDLQQQMMEQLQVRTKGLVQNASRLRSVCGKHPLSTTKTCLVLFAWEPPKSQSKNNVVPKQSPKDSDINNIRPHQGDEHVGIGL